MGSGGFTPEKKPSVIQARRVVKECNTGEERCEGDPLRRACIGKLGEEYC